MNKKLKTNLVRLVKLLNDGEYHDGTTIGDKLKMTRSAVWKVIKKLVQYGIQIDSVKGKGYAMQEPLLLLDKNYIKKNLNRSDVELNIFENIDSTNSYLKSADKSSGIQICLAEQQTKGRGRFNREWHSPFAKNIYLSCLYSFQKDVSELSGLSLVVGLAVTNVLKMHGVNKKLFVKWPNDIIYDGKKISGNLIEIQAETNGVTHAVIGIGVNVNMLDAEWISMQEILGEYVDRNIFCVNLLNNIFDYLSRFEKEGLRGFLNEWKESDCYMNKLIAVTSVNDVVQGVVQGINEQGHLLLQMKDGNIRAFSSGDTSVVKGCYS